MMVVEGHALGVMAALGSAAAWAVGAFLFKALGEVLSPLALTLAKGACSLVFLGAVMVLLGAQPMNGRALLLLSTSGLLGIALGDTFFFQALQGLGPQPLLVLAVLGQVLTAVLGVVCLGEKLTLGAWLGVGLVIAGVTIVMQGELSQEEAATEGVNPDSKPVKSETVALIDPPADLNVSLQLPFAVSTRSGVIFGLLAVVCMSVSTIVAKAGLGESGETIQATFVRMMAGTLGVFCYGLAVGRLGQWVMPLRNARLFVLFLASVVVITFGGFWLSMVAFKYTSVAVASTLTSTEPIFALILAALIFREKVTLRAAAGTLTTALGVGFIFVL
jgi:drug/metabolite transporter (DMT)-like permease